MAIHNPSNLYSGGQAVFNSTPFTNFVLQQQARKKAKDEALTQYFTHIPDKLNTAGVRQQDLQDPNGNGGILNDMGSIREYWMQNKEAIKRGGAAQQAYMAKVQQVANNIERSKARGKTELDIGKATFEGKFRPRHDDLPVIEKLSKSIYDPTSKKEDGVSEYGFQDLSGSVPRYDVNKQKQFDALTLGTAKPVYDESKARVDNTTGEVFIPKTFDSKTVNTAALAAANAIKSDKSAYYHYEDLLEDEKAVKELTGAFQDFYKTDEIVDTPEKAAMADRILKLQASSGEEKVRDVNYADKLKRDLMDKRRKEGMEDWKIKNQITHQQKKERIRLNNEGRIYEIDNVPLKIRAAAKTQPSIYGGIQATDVTDWSDAELGDVLGTKTDKYGQRLHQPIVMKTTGRKFIKVLPNGFEVEDADGNPVVIEDKEVIVNTDKRTRGLEKPVGTGKAKIRTNTPPERVGLLNDL